MGPSGVEPVSFPVMIRLSVKMTSSAVSGLPSWKMMPGRIRGPAQDGEGRVPRQDLRGQEHDDGNQEQGQYADGQPARGENEQGMFGPPRDGLLRGGDGYRHGGPSSPC